MMEEELQESEILWPSYDRSGHNDSLEVAGRQRPWPLRAPKKGTNPIDIPARATSQSWTQGFAYRDKSNSSDDDENGGGGDDEEEMVPPHVLVAARRRSEKVAFSVCVGNGRTLKGRDLSHVRNSILRMTGFLER